MNKNQVRPIKEEETSLRLRMSISLFLATRNKNECQAAGFASCEAKLLELERRVPTIFCKKCGFVIQTSQENIGYQNIGDTKYLVN